MYCTARVKGNHPQYSTCPDPGSTVHVQPSPGSRGIIHSTVHVQTLAVQYMSSPAQGQGESSTVQYMSRPWQYSTCPAQPRVKGNHPQYSTCPDPGSTVHVQPSPRSRGIIHSTVHVQTLAVQYMSSPAQGQGESSTVQYMSRVWQYS